MSKINFFGIVVIVFTLLAACKTNNITTTHDIIVSDGKLFEKNNTNWFESGDADWEFTKGELIGTAADAAGFVMTKSKYKNFELTLEFLPDSTINSGIYIRCDSMTISAIDCYELNIWDLHPNQKNRTGSIVTRAEPLAYVETLDKWNSYKIRMSDDHIEAWINGVKTADLYDAKNTEGYIALQSSGEGVIKFKNVVLKNIE